MIKICEYCGKEFETDREIKRFCCRQCKEKSKQSRKCKGIRLDNIEYTKVCSVCNTEFVTTHQDKKYCSKKCKNKVMYQKNKGKYTYVSTKVYHYTYNLICKTCGKPFEASAKNTKYCLECRQEGRYTHVCKKCGKTFVGKNHICDECKTKDKGLKKIRYTKECVVYIPNIVVGIVRKLCKIKELRFTVMTLVAIINKPKRNGVKNGKIHQKVN